MPDDIDDGDLMLGAEPIARFLTQLFDGEQITPTDVYNWCSRGALPHSKLGAKLVGSNPKGTGWLDPAAYDRTVKVLLSGKSAPVITKAPDGAWTHDVFDKAMAMQ